MNSSNLDNPATGGDDMHVPVAEDDELLVAYLDGELDNEQSAIVESRLATETALRSRLQRLQQSWDLLDRLPSTELNPSFTQSTIELVIAQARKEARKEAQGRSLFPWRIPLQMAAAFALLLVTAFLSFSVARYYQQAELRELISNLSFYENHELYRDFQQVQFLEELNEHGLMPEEISPEELANDN